MENSIDRQQVRQHFSRHARDYDRLAKVQQQVAERLSDLLAAQRCDWNLALEIGCGTGLLSRRVIDRFPKLPLILSDIAHGMSVATSELFPGYPICDADAARLPFQDAAFDLVISSSVYQWLDDLPAAFSEAARVLACGGLFAVALFGERTLHELRSSHHRALSGKSSHSQSFASRDAVVRALGDSFSLISGCSEFEVEWHADVSGLLHNLKRIGAQNASRNRPAGLASRQVMARMIDHYQQQFGCARGIPATYEVIYLLARRRREVQKTVDCRCREIREATLAHTDEGAAR